MNDKDILVIHPYLKKKRINKDYFLEEAINLVKAINLNCIDSLLVGLDTISPKTYLNKGFIRKGYDADFTIVDMKKKFIVKNENIESKCGWSPFEGQKFDNSINRTILNGNVVYEDGRVNSIPHGKKITFNR